MISPNGLVITLNDNVSHIYHLVSNKLLHNICYHWHWFLMANFINKIYEKQDINEIEDKKILLKTWMMEYWPAKQTKLLIKKSSEGHYNIGDLLRESDRS